MIDVAPQTSPKPAEHFIPDEKHDRPPTPFVTRAVCIILAILAIALAYAVHQKNAQVADARAQLVQANTATDQVKADLAKANALAVDLRLQLDRAKGLRSDLQSQLAKAQGQQSDLQSQLEKARANLQSQQDKAAAQSAGLQAEINQANGGLSRLQKELDQAKGQNEDLSAKLAKAEAGIAKLQPLAVKARVLPVSATIEKVSFWSAGFTMHVRNLNSSPLNVNITIGASGKTPSMSATIEGGGTLNIGNLAAGADVVIASEGYDPAKLTVR